jgi:Ca-activated chloride channel family protein
MEFTNPTILYLALGLIILLPLAGLLIVWRRKADYRAFGSPEAFQRLLDHLSPTRRLIKLLLVLGGLFLITLALAGPQWGSKMVEVRRRGVDVFIALDVSRSMLAEDVKPNRLQRAQQELASLIDHLKGDRIGVIAFAGNAQVACPLTTDYEAAKMFLNYLTPDSITIPGTSLGDAIRLAAGSFPKGSEGSRVLVLLTDGEDHHSKPEEASQAAKAAGVRILSIGFGTAGGEPIPIRDDAGHVTGYMKDNNGKSVVSHLDEALLKQITAITQGAYWPAANGSLEAERMAELIGQMQKRDISAGQYGAYEDRFQFVLFPGLLLLLLGLWLPQRKRAWLFLLPFGVLIMTAGTARADVGSDVNQGNAAYGKQRYEQAVQKYQDAQIKSPDSPVVQYDLGNALHKMGKFEEADAAYHQVIKAKVPKLKAKAWYNLGNNFLQQQKFNEAIEQYKQALKLDPKDEDALHNMAMALRFLKKPPDQKQNQPNPQSGQGQNKPDQQKGQQEQDNKNQGSSQYQKSQRPSGPDDKGEQKPQNKNDTTNSNSAQGNQKAPKPGEMSERDASNLLDAIREAEQEAQRKRLSGTADKGKKGRGNAVEDW